MKQAYVVEKLNHNTKRYLFFLFKQGLQELGFFMYSDIGDLNASKSMNSRRWRKQKDGQNIIS